MAAEIKIPHGTAEWLEMLGEEMCAGATAANLAADYDVSLVERFTDGKALAGGLVEGFRFDIIGGKPSFRIGVAPDERGDITILLTWAASRGVARLYAADPEHQALFEHYLQTGEMQIDGDFAALASWIPPVHDAVVKRTA